MIPEADLAVGRLDPFDQTWVTEYPEFKDPTQGDLTPGTSLCKLGYPFPELRPVFDEATSSFSLPADTVIVFFPLEGMYTRGIEIAKPTTAIPYPLNFIETSSPGLRGQSGGPTFDTTGAIWAIQSQTRYLPLDFSPEMKQGGTTVKEHQFLGVGMGVHVETVVGLFKQLGIKHTLSK